LVLTRSLPPRGVVGIGKSCSDLVSCWFGSTVAAVGVRLAGGRTDAMDGGFVVADPGENLSSVLAGADDGDACCVVSFLKASSR
jgi:hypothetical protein